MSPRERNLLLLFAAAGFLVLNVIGFGFLKSKQADLDRKLAAAEQNLEDAQIAQTNAQEVGEEMQWLADHEAEPIASQNVGTSLQQICEAEAKSAGLTIKTQRPLDADETEGRHYHRAKMQINVVGKEEALYQWLDKLNEPDSLRIATQLRLSPDDKDDTLIDCTAIIEQWFVPIPQ